MSYLTNLISRREAIAAELAALDGLTTEGKNAAGGKPNLSHTDGGTAIDHQGYKASLYAELLNIDKLIREDAQTQATIAAGSREPFEIATEVFP
jgi:hypothetical protein